MCPLPPRDSPALSMLSAESARRGGGGRGERGAARARCAHAPRATRRPYRCSRPKARGVTLFALIRHMPTAWNAAGRLQGGEDVPVDSATAPKWQIPPELAHFRWWTSPLRRARDTARLLGIPEPVIEPRLSEMHWGKWEGKTLTELR